MKDHKRERMNPGDHCMSVTGRLVHLVLEERGRGHGGGVKLACGPVIPLSAALPSVAMVTCGQCLAAPPLQHGSPEPAAVVAPPLKEESKPQEPEQRRCRLCEQPLSQIRWNKKGDILTCLNPHCGLANKLAGWVRKELPPTVSQGMPFEGGKENGPDQERDPDGKIPVLTEGQRGAGEPAGRARLPPQRRTVTRGIVKDGAKAGKAGTLHPPAMRNMRYDFDP